MSTSSKEQEVNEEVEDRVAPRGEVIYESILREGEHELERELGPLAFSGLAAGLSMGFSFVAEALLRVFLPEARWTPAVAKFGYSIGFLIVILGRQQLFTKNTLTVMLPLFSHRKPTRIASVARLWSVVFATNLLGAGIFAAFIAYAPAFDPEVKKIFAQISQELPIEAGFWSVLVRSVFAGWLIALMIWLLPYAETARVGVIVLLAYLVGLGHFPHIVAGSVPTFYGMLIGTISTPSGLFGFLLPTLLGNIIGGVALVAAGAHAEFVGEREK